MSETQLAIPARITPDQLRSFAETGSVRLGRVVDDATLEGLRERIDRIMLGEVVYDDMTMQLDADSDDYASMPAMSQGHKGATLSYRKIEQLEQDDRFRAYLRSPLIRSICDALVGPEVAIYRSMFMNKPANQGTVLPWHQDGGRQWNLTHDPLVTIWLALDPARRANGCVQVIPGSHRLGLLSEQGHLVADEHVARHCRDEDVEFLECEAGEALLLHNFLIHRSGRNETDVPRRAFSVCLMPAGTRRRDRPDQRFPVLFGEEAEIAGCKDGTEGG